MKRYISIVSFFLLLTLAACGGQSFERETIEDPAQDTSAAALGEEELAQQEAEIAAAAPSKQIAPATAAEVAPTQVEPAPAEPSQVAEPAPVTESPQAESAVKNWLIVEGKTDDNLSYLGNPDAPVTIIDYSDFLWGACRSYVVGTEPEVKENYVKTGQARLIFNPMLDHGDRSLQAHQAAECAAEQGNFWAMHDVIFEHQRELYGGNIQDTLKGLAAEIGLAPEEFNTCLDEQRYADLVQSQDENRRAKGVRTRPTFDINGQLVVGSQGFDAFQNVVDAQLVQ